MTGIRTSRFILLPILVVAMWAPAGLASATTVSPSAISANASIWSEISFRGLPASEAGSIEVTGSISGDHDFTARRHSDDRGFSLIMELPFDPAEQVNISTDLEIPGAVDGDYTFITENIGFPRPKNQRREEVVKGERQPFRSRPALRPFSLQVRAREDEAGDDPVFVGSKTYGGAIFSAAGRLIWFKPMRATDFRTQSYHGKPVLTWIQAPSPGAGLERTSYIIADRSYRVIKRIVPGNGYRADTHEFRLTPRGTAYITSYRTVQRDLRPIGLTEDGRVTDSIAQEIDLDTGRVIWEWHSLDQVPVTDSYTARVRREGSPFDYFHINSVIDTPDGNVMVSGRSTSAIYEIKRRSGRPIWTLGGKSSDFAFGPGAAFSWQHDAEPLNGNRISLFDNADAFVSTGPSAEQSRGLVLNIDEPNMVATLVTEFLNPDRVLSPSQANVQALPSGNFFIGWGQSPLISEHSPEGGLVFDARLRGTNSAYRAYRQPWVGRPRGPVAITADRARGFTSVWVSWNGDTSVRRWRILTGPNRRHLEAFGTRPRTGFETQIRLPNQDPYVKVLGLDASGRVIGSSRTVVVR
ncbi:MAG: arylsulfotransferase family protein [Thermoleophilia bacterium]|nr:arylsulfotransferase family protein [Thermoleophilia bacterium]